MRKLFKTALIFTVFALPALGQTNMPSLPDDVPNDYTIIGGLLYLAEAAEKCGFRSEDWTKAVVNDGAHASDAMFSRMYPNGVPPGVQLDAEGYATKMMEAGANMSQAQCQQLQNSNLLAAGDAAASHERTGH